MLLCANAALEENKQKINELNVFPVPDGDTGTNMSLTMNSAAIELGRKQTDTVGAVADCAARFVYLKKYCLICDIIIISKINHYGNKRNVLQ